MKRSDWITIVSVLLTTMGSIIHSSYKFGNLTATVAAFEKNTEKYMEKNDKEIAEIKTDIKEMKVDISEIRVEMAEMRVRLYLYK